MVLLAAQAQAGTEDLDVAGGNRVGVHRFEAVDAGSGVSVKVGSALGPDGGVTATTLAAHFRRGPLAVHVGLPFAVYPTPVGNTADLGNLMISAFAVVEKPKVVLAWGAEFHVSVGQRAYTWVNRPDEFWPGGGVELIGQLRTTGSTAFLGRLSLGIHGARGYEPYPKLFPHGTAVVGIDQTLHAHVGVSAEAAFSYWDTSPIELSVFGRFDIITGLRARTGIVMPIAAWAGWTPAGAPAGVREATWINELSMAL